MSSLPTNIQDSTSTLDPLLDHAQMHNAENLLINQHDTAIASILSTVYTKPGTGIPESDLDTTTQAKINNTTNYVFLAANPDSLVFGTITRDSNEAVTSASVIWPDGATGTFTADTVSSAFPGAVDAYHITHVLGGSTTTYTQPLVTRDAAGAVTTRPSLVVS